MLKILFEIKTIGNYKKKIKYYEKKILVLEQAIEYLKQEDLSYSLLVQSTDKISCD